MIRYITFYICALLTVLVSAHELIEPMIKKKPAARNSIILQPEFSGEQVGAILFFGLAGSDPNQYKEHFQAVQNKTHFPLWISISCMDIEPSAKDFEDDVVAAQTELLDKAASSNPKVDKIFYGGHANSARMMNTWLYHHAQDAEGSFGLGAFAGDNQDWLGPTSGPYLTLGAALDGGSSRITRLAQSFDKLKMFEKTEKDVRWQFPIYVIPGIGLSSFMQGNPPADFMSTDIRAEVSGAEAIDTIGEIISSFIVVTREGKDSSTAQDAAACMEKNYNLTSSQLNPLIEMLEMEGNMWMSAYKNSTPWIQKAQEYVAGELNQKYKLDYFDQWRLQTTFDHLFEHAKPSVSPEVGKEGYYNVSSYSHNSWNPVKDGYETPYWAAIEDGAKLRSREAIYSYFKEPFGPSANVTEAQCKGINEFALAWVRNQTFFDKTLQRYDAHGQPLKFLEDSESLSGPTWVSRYLIWQNTTEAMTVQARRLLSPMNFPVKEAAGMLYCKLISPARIMEWMLVDGLYQKLYWIPNTIEQEGDGPQESEQEEFAASSFIQ